MNTEEIAKNLLNDYGEDVGNFIIWGVKRVQETIGLTLDEAEYYLDNVDWYKFLYEAIKEDIQQKRMIEKMSQEHYHH